MTREARLGRALVLLILAMIAQPLLALGCMQLDHDGMAPPAHGTTLFSATDNDDDNALDVVFGGDPVVFAHGVGLPLLESRGPFAAPAPAHVLPSCGDSADHPPRLA